MCAFTIGGNEKNQFSSGISFGSAQAMQKKQEDADAKKAEEKKSLSQGDTVSISDEAKAAINKQLGRVEDSSEEKSTGNASLDNLKKQVTKAEDAIDKINGSQKDEDESNTIEIDTEGFKMEFKDTDRGGSVRREPTDEKSEDEELADEEAAEDKKIEEEEASSLETLKQDTESQIKKRQADIRAATSDTSEEGQAKKQMLQAQLMALENTLTELEAKTDD